MHGPYDVVDTGKRLKVEYGEMIDVRLNVTLDDAGNPTNFSNCHDLTGWEYIDVYIEITGTNPSWDITPIFGQYDGSVIFHDAETITVQKNEIRRIRIFGAPCLYFRCDGSSGTLPKIDSLRIRPVNIVS